MDKIQSTNLLQAYKVRNQIPSANIATPSIPQDSFEKSDSGKVKKIRNIVAAVVGGIVALFAAYKGAKYLKNVVKSKSLSTERGISIVEPPKIEGSDRGIRVLEPTHIERPTHIEPPKKTKVEGISVKDAEIIEPVNVPTDDVIDGVKPSVINEISTAKVIKPTEKAEQLAEEYKQLMSSGRFSEAHQKLRELKDEGFVIFNDKLVHKTSKEAFAPLKVIPTEKIHAVDDVEILNVKCPSFVKSADSSSVEVINPENFGIENLHVRSYNYTNQGDAVYFRENSRLKPYRYGGLAQEYPGEKRSWLMGHDYVVDAYTSKKRYVTTLAFGEGTNRDGRNPGFILSLEGDYGVETMELLKDRLIKTGLIDDLILTDSYEAGRKIMDKLVDEVIAFMNKK